MTLLPAQDDQNGLSSSLATALGLDLNHGAGERADGRRRLQGSDDETSAECLRRAGAGAAPDSAGPDCSVSSSVPAKQLMRRLRLPDEDDGEPLGGIEAGRRARERRDLATPSAVIRRMQADWPALCGTVARLAVEMGVTKAEAWRRAICAGVEVLAEEL